MFENVEKVKQNKDDHIEMLSAIRQQYMAKEERKTSGWEKVNSKEEEEENWSSLVLMVFILNKKSKNEFEKEKRREQTHETS